MKMCAVKYFYISGIFGYFFLYFAELMLNTFQHLLFFYFNENKILFLFSSVPSFLFPICRPSVFIKWKITESCLAYSGER